MIFNQTIILLMLCVSVTMCATIENVRPKRTLHYFLEGLLSAFSEKHRSHNSKTIPFSGLSKLSILSGGTKNLNLDPFPLPLPSQIPFPNARISTTLGPTKISLPIISSSTPAIITTTTTSTVKQEITAVTTDIPTTLPNTELPTTESPIVTSITIIPEDSITTIQPCDDSIPNTLPTPTDSTTPLSNEIQETLDKNATTSNAIGIKHLPVYDARTPYQTSGRHTQFFGNPLVLEPHQLGQHVPVYYDEYNANCNDVDSGDIRPYHGPQYLPPPIIMLPMAVSMPPHINRENARTGNSHSRVKMHDNDFNHYIWHGPGVSPIPIVHLHQTHVQFFGKTA